MPAVRAFKQEHSEKAQPQPRKKSIEELVEGQNSGAEPGGELGRQDPGRKEAPSGTAGRELHVDAELRSALTPLLARTRERLMERQAGGTVSDADVASAAVAAAEASGAMPPLAGPQRVAVEGFFACLAADLAGGAGEAHEAGGAFEPFSTSESEAGFGNGEEDAALRIKPHHRELLEEVINFHLGSGGATRISSSPRDSMKAGGEVGNIALQSDMHHTARVRGVPAQSESDRAERQVEEQFHQMELADLPHASTADFADQREWEADPEGQAGNAAIEGDAPAAGGGLQAVESEAEVRQLSGTNEYSTAVDQMDWTDRHKEQTAGEDAPKKEPEGKKFEKE